MGAIFSIIAITTSIGYVTYSMHLLDNFSKDFLTTNQERSNAMREQFKVSKVGFVNNKFNLTVQNTGGIPINITRIYIQNTTATDWFASYSVNSAIPQSSSVKNIGMNIPLDAIPTNSYSVKLVTDRGNSQEILIRSTSSSPVPLQLIVLPSSVPSGFTTTILLGVTNNMTNDASLADVKPVLSVISGDAVATLVSGPTPTSYDIPNGNTVYFVWVYQISGSTGSSVTFNATLQNAFPNNFVTSKITVEDVRFSSQSQTSLKSNGLSTLSINDNILVLHQETTNALNGYQMYSASSDTAGKIIQLDTTNPVFYTNNDTVTVSIPAGKWVHTLRYLSSPIPSTISTASSIIFHFEDGLSATLAKDSTGNTGGLTLGTAGGKPSWLSTNGVNGSGAFSFNGAQYMDNLITSYDNIGTQDTTSGWFKTSSTSRQVILRMGSSGDISPFYEIGLDTGSNAGRVLFRFSDNTNGIVDGLCESPSGTNYANGVWHHFVAEKTGNHMCTLYVDGVSVSTNSISCSCTFTVISTSNKISIGRDDSTSGKNYFNGNLDDVIHWNSYNLTPSQVTDLYKTNYGTASHKLTFVFDIVDKNGNFIQHVNTTSISMIPVNFADSFGTYSSPTNTAWGLYNFTFNAPSITLDLNQRLKLQDVFVNNAGNGQLNMKFEIDNLSIGGVSTLNSLLQIPDPDPSLPGYYTYDSSGPGTIQIYNSGPYMAWITGNSRVVFESLDETRTYASWLCNFSTFPHSVTADSPLLTVGASTPVCFSIPSTQPNNSDPQGGVNIPPGTYRMYVYVNGYDQKGNVVLATEYVGPVKVT